MAARTAELALFVDQLVAALQAITPVLAGSVFVGGCGADLIRNRRFRLSLAW